MKPRSTLKSYFTKGAIPKESDFADLIDSVLIQDEDTVFKSANDPLSIKATGAEETLLNFYRVEQGNNTLTWQLKQKPTGAKPGLSIGDSAGTSLFIESGSGNVGVGTITPGAKLEVNGATNVNGGLTVTGQTKLSAAVGIGREPIANQQLVITPAAGNMPLNVTDPSNSINWLSVFSNGNVIMNGGNVGIGTMEPKATLTITGDLIRRVAIATGLGPGDQTDNGQIVSRVLSFSKQYADTAIRILYCDNFRIFNINNAPIGTAARWEIRIDGKSVPGGAIFQDKFGLTGNFHEPATILGYAKGISVGVHEIQIWVGPLGAYPIEAYTGWLDSRWTIEAQEVWLK